MTIDTKEAYKAVLENKGWKSKVYICGLIPVIGIIFVNLAAILLKILFTSLGLTDFGLAKILSFTILGLTNIYLVSIAAGYFIKAIRNSFHNCNDFIPDLKTNFKKNVFVGFKYISGITLICLLWFGPCIIFLILSSLRLMNSTSMAIAMLVFILLAILSSIFLIPALTIYYATNLKFRSLFNFKQAFQIIKHGEYPKSSSKKEHAFSSFLICSISIRFLSGIVEWLLSITLVGILAIPFVEGFVLFMTAYLLAQVYHVAINDFKNTKVTVPIQSK